MREGLLGRASGPRACPTNCQSRPRVHQLLPRTAQHCHPRKSQHQSCEDTNSRLELLSTTTLTQITSELHFRLSASANTLNPDWQEIHERVILMACDQEENEELQGREVNGINQRQEAIQDEVRAITRNLESMTSTIFSLTHQVERLQAGQNPPPAAAAPCPTYPNGRPWVGGLPRRLAAMPHAWWNAVEQTSGLRDEPPCSRRAGLVRSTLPFPWLSSFRRDHRL